MLCGGCLRAATPSRSDPGAGVALHPHHLRCWPSGAHAFFRHRRRGRAGSSRRGSLPGRRAPTQRSRGSCRGFRRTRRAAGARRARRARRIQPNGGHRHAREPNGAGLIADARGAADVAPHSRSPHRRGNLASLVLDQIQRCEDPSGRRPRAEQPPTTTLNDDGRNDGRRDRRSYRCCSLTRSTTTSRPVLPEIAKRALNAALLDKTDAVATRSPRDSSGCARDEENRTTRTSLVERWLQRRRA